MNWKFWKRRKWKKGKCDVIWCKKKGADEIFDFKGRRVYCSDHLFEEMNRYRKEIQSEKRMQWECLAHGLTFEYGPCCKFSREIKRKIYLGT